MDATLLVELLTEELPPRSLRMLADTFAEQLLSEIVKHRLKDRAAAKRTFATPRRLAVLIPDVRDKALDSSHSVEGPVSSNPKAVEGFARKHKVSAESLERRRTDKGEIVVANFTLPGVQLDAVLAGLVEQVLKNLPVRKLMRWGDGDAQFVRPVHGLVMMHGTRVVPGTVLGVSASSTTHGHRFMGTGSIALANAGEYEARLRDDGMVIADFAARRAEIERQLVTEAKRLAASLGEYGDLLDEVTALVEHPSVYVGAFDSAYLEVPQECLILTMRKNQKYFPLFDSAARLLPKFLIVSNMQVADPRHIIDGNQRVVRPRLEDARFFFDQDRKTRLEARVPQLAKVVYHNKLGSQLERVERIQLLAGRIARALGADAALAERAAWLCKADLLTGMVGEFPELQGVMGRYYARHDGEPDAVADAIEAHYLPRFAGDRLPLGPIACAVALADKLYALAGLFGIGQQPTGERDPYGLRRAALGIIRIVVENQLPLALNSLVSDAFAAFNGAIGDAHTDLESFIFERFSGYLREQGFSTLQVDAVLSQRPAQISLVPRQLEAVKAFQALPEAESLAAANKRIRNILHKSPPPTADLFSEARLAEPAERALYQAFRKVDAIAQSRLAEEKFTDALSSLAALKAPVDEFFDRVMVNVDDPELRNNRLLLLMQLDHAMNRVADISRLAA
ncbi:MAG TPA: glycine--tRNA ligase subunit beta [Burkholderiales bacterium]|nr:glycine--tRNA ligase subunit beta [Burkholderiales bacterium]